VLSDESLSLGRRGGLKRHILGGASGKVFRGMLLLLAGHTAGRAVGLASMPVLTRIYDPGHFGVLAVFTALVALLAPLVSLRYVQALPLPRHDGVAMNLLVLALALILTFSLITAALLWTFGPSLLSLISMQVLAPWWWLLSLGVFGTALYEAFSLWATRNRAYRVIAITSVWQNIFGVAAKLGLGLIGLKPAGLLLGQVIAQGGGTGWLLRNGLSTFRANMCHVSLHRIRMVALRWRGFPAWRVPSQGLMVVAQQVPLLFAAAVFSPQATGQLSLAVTSLALPLSLLGNSAGQALYAEAARERDPRRVREMAQQTQRRLFLIALVPTGILLLFGERMFGFVFGAQWREAGVYAQILSISLLFQFCSAPLMQLMNLVAKQVLFLLINLGRILMIGMVAGSTLALNLDIYGFVTYYSIVLCVFYLLVSWVAMRSISSIDRRA